MTYQREFIDRLRIAVVGVGSHSYRNILPTLHHLPVSLTALCDVDEPLVRRTAEEYGVPAYTDSTQMYAETQLDAVLICVGAEQHPKLAIQAFEAGLHVWLEKPPGMSVDDVAAMQAAVGNRTCGVGFKKAYLPAIRKAKELMATDDFGLLRSMLAVYPVSIPAGGAEVIADRRRSKWLSNGCHPIAALLELGGKVRQVRALLGPGDNAVGSVHLDFVNGAVGTLFLADGFPAGCPVERYDVVGDRRAITIDDSSTVTYHRGIPYQYSRQTDFTGPGTATGSVVWRTANHLASLESSAMAVQGMYDELLDFCAAVLDDRPLRTGDLGFAADVMRIYEAAIVSDGQPIDVVSPDQSVTR